MDAFNIEEGFAELLGVWKIEGNVSEARMLYATQVHGETAAECHTAIMEAARVDAKSGWKTVPLPSYLRKRHGARVPAKPTTQRPRPAPSIATATPVPEQVDHFAVAWALWPRDPTRMPEDSSVANFEWDRAVARVGLDDVRDATALYCKRGVGLDHPVNLATFLAESDLRALAKAARMQPSESDVAAFRAAYEKFPKVGRGDESDDLDLYCYRIKPDERFDFLVAVSKYADQKKGAEKEYVKSWSAFCAGAWRKVDCRRRLLDYLAVAVEKHGGSGISDRKGTAAEIVRSLGLDVDVVIALATRYLLGTATSADYLDATVPESEPDAWDRLMESIEEDLPPPTAEQLRAMTSDIETPTTDGEELPL
jgi:hypothetical protein